MFFISRFESIDGIPNEEQIEEWTESFFHSLLNILNSFFSHVSVEEAVSRMELVPFAELVQDELRGESEEIVAIAVSKVNELAEIELAFMRSYL
ncbi:MAG TPA: hypothetical protein GX404_00435 [Syntrophomonadaceae bacterium]|nr:hypothetical protein [Syntrophomonadaceae bacterium]